MCYTHLQEKAFSETNHFPVTKQGSILRKESMVKFMKNVKQNKVVEKIIMRYMQNNTFQYQRLNTEADFFKQKEEESKQYEQQNYKQMNEDIVYFMLLVQTMQKKVRKMKRTMKEMADSMEKNNDTLQRMEKKFKKQSDEIDRLCQKVSKQKAELKKEQSQAKQLKKIIRCIGMRSGINSMSDNLDKILKKYSERIGTYGIQGRARREVFDTSAYISDLNERK